MEIQIQISKLLERHAAKAAEVFKSNRSTLRAVPCQLSSLLTARRLNRAEV